MATGKLGLECKLYRQTSGSRAAWPATGNPSNLSEITNVKDVTLTLDAGEADISTRNNNGFKATIGTLKDGAIEFDMVWDGSDTHFTALRTAFFANTSVALACLDAAFTVAGAQGLWADFRVIGFKREEPLEGAVMAKITVKPTYSAVPAEWAVVVLA